MSFKKNVAAIAVGLSLFGSVCFGIDLKTKTEAEVNADIKAHIISEYRESTSVVKSYLIDQNKKAYKRVAGYDLDAEALAALNKIIDDYYPNFTVIDYMFKKELEAIEKLKEE